MQPADTPSSQLYENIAIPQAQIAAVCRHHHVRKLAVFGSVLRDDFGPDSDVDMLVEFESDYPPTLTTLLTLERELTETLNRQVDLGEQQSVVEDPNYIRRNRILNSLQVIYAR